MNWGIYIAGGVFVVLVVQLMELPIYINLPFSFFVGYGMQAIVTGLRQ